MTGETTCMRTPRRSPIALILLAFLSLAGAGAGAATLPRPVSQEPFAFQRVGSGDLRWFGMHIYEASLWSPDGRFDGLASRQPMALSLWYGRDFSREELLRITGTAWKLLGETSAGATAEVDRRSARFLVGRRQGPQPHRRRRTRRRNPLL